MGDATEVAEISKKIKIKNIPKPKQCPNDIVWACFQNYKALAKPMLVAGSCAINMFSTLRKRRQIKMKCKMEANEGAV